MFWYRTKRMMNKLSFIENETKNKSAYFIIETNHGNQMGTWELGWLSMSRSQTNVVVIYSVPIPKQHPNSVAQCPSKLMRSIDNNGLLLKPTSILWHGMAIPLTQRRLTKQYNKKITQKVVIRPCTIQFKKER